MSTYRPSTRASTRASLASSVGGAATPTPRTPSLARGGRRKAPSTIASELGMGPQVIPTKESTSYGSSAAVVPLALQRVEEEDLRGALEGIVAPTTTTAETPAGQRVAVGSVPPTRNSTASFGQQSSDAGHGTFTGAIPAAIPAPVTAGKPRRRKAVAPTAERAVPLLLRGPTPPPAVVAEEPSVAAAVAARDAVVAPASPAVPAAPVVPVVPAALSRIAAFLTRARATLAAASSHAIFHVALVALVSVLVTFTYVGTSDSSAARATRLYARGATTTLAQYIPHGIAHPLNYLSEADMLDVQRRLRVAELDISKLKIEVVRTRDLANALDKRLPDFLAVKKVRGEVQIPADFWRALKTTILSSKDLLQAINAKKSTEPVRATPDWNDFLRHNQIRLKDMVAGDIRMAREDILKHLESALTTIRHDVSGSLAKASQAVKSQLADHITSLPATATKAEIDSLIERAVHRAVLSSKIEALINTKLAESSSSSLRRVNHFAPVTGANINLRLTSATHIPKPKNDRTNLITILLRLLSCSLPTPQPPINALTKWEEQGDCWCGAPFTGTSGVQLAVQTAHKLSPDEFVLEHIPRTATLDPGTTPRHVEIFARVPLKNQDIVSAVSTGLFPEEVDAEWLDDEWLRIGRGVYDIDGDAVQVFPIQLVLGRYGVSAKEYVVRVRDNWGSSTSTTTGAAAANGRAGDDNGDAPTGVDATKDATTCIYRVRMHGEVV